MDLIQIIDLFESKHTAMLADRQATAIIQLCKQMVNEEYQKGFYFKELPQVARILELIHERLHNKNVSWRAVTLILLVRNDRGAGLATRCS